MQNDVLRQRTLFSMFVVFDVSAVHVVRLVVVTILPPRPTAKHVVVLGRHETACRKFPVPVPLTWRVQVAPPSVVVTIGGSGFGFVCPDTLA